MVQFYVRAILIYSRISLFCTNAFRSLQSKPLSH